MDADAGLDRERARVAALEHVARGVAVSGAPLRPRIMALLAAIVEHDKYHFFASPVDSDLYPDYLDVVARPMDLSTVGVKAELGMYTTLEDFEADLELVWANCIEFNQEPNAYHLTAVELRSFSTAIIQGVAADM
ncbi:Bromodomain-containing protein, partial [Blastocladiella britannica]